MLNVARFEPDIPLKKSFSSLLVLATVRRRWWFGVVIGFPTTFHHFVSPTAGPQSISR